MTQTFFETKSQLQYMKKLNRAVSGAIQPEMR